MDIDAAMYAARIYTRRGDDGTSAVRASARLSKSDPLFELLGGLDELNAVIGAAAHGSAAHEAAMEPVQHALLDIGTLLATPASMSLPARSRFCSDAIGDATVLALEREIDALTGNLPPLRNFVLPRGLFHWARAVCRRVERCFAAYRVSPGTAHSSDAAFRYVNRLSDFLFEYARAAHPGVDLLHRS